MKMKSKLKDLLYEHRMSQKDLHLKTGISVSTIGKLYHNTSDRYDKHTLLTICDFFNLNSISDLIEIDRN